MILIDPAIQTRFGRVVRRRALAGFLAEACAAARLTGDIPVLLTTDQEIRRLNREFRRKDKATDVLSFPALDPVNGQEAQAGDLAVSVETAERQAAEAGHALFVELQVLVLHGVLHLAGYDHERDSGQMARRETTLRKRFGLGSGLIERSATAARTRPAQRRGSRQS